MPWGADMNGVDGLEQSLNQLEQKWTTDETIVYVVGTNVEYAVPVEFGTDPHTIEADDGGVLHFTIDGEEVFVKSVDHPGTPAQPYMRPAVDQVQAQLDSVVADANGLDDALGQIAAAVERAAKQYAPVDSGNLRASIEAEKNS